ncbi:MAG: uridine kinase [Myxococcota bacterium]
MGDRRKDPPKRGTQILVEEGETRIHVESPLMMESLIDKGLIDGTRLEHEVSILPDVHLVHLGGRLVDRGAEALPRLIDEFVELRRRHKLVIGVGGGIRERHTFAQCVDLDLPTGALAQLTGVMCKQNATMVFYLLAQHGGVRVPREDFPKLPFYLEAGGIPVIVDMAPYHFWEHLGSAGRIPPHRPDTGAFLLAEVYSCRSCIYVKDVDGLYSDDPKTHPDAEFIPRISAADLLARNLPDLCIERAVLETLQLARNRVDVRIINGLVPGNLARAIEGEEIGTLIHQ